jgi:hypothetical protein
MVGAAQADRARSDASGGPSGSRHLTGIGQFAAMQLTIIPDFAERYIRRCCSGGSERRMNSALGFETLGQSGRACVV